MGDNDYPVNWGSNEMEYLKSLDAKTDNVNSPSHYNQHGVECIDAIRASLGSEFESYCKGNVMKYLWRYKYKNGVEDLKKAQVYLNWMVETTEGK
jgi:hypothetical protein